MDFHQKVKKNRQLRRAELAEAIKRQRHSLQVMKIAERSAPLSMKYRLGSQIQEIKDELRKMEDEFHELNVQQIRKELAGE